MGDKKRKLPKSFGKETDCTFLNGIKAHILKAGIENARMKIFNTQLTKYGGTLCSEFSDDITHLVVDEKVELTRILNLLKVDEICDTIIIVKTNWLSKCFKEKCLVDINEYLVKRSIPKPKVDTSELESSKAVDDKLKFTSTKLPGPSASTDYDGHLSKRRKVNFSDSENSSDNDSDNGRQLERQVSVPSTENMLKRGNWVCTQSSLNPKDNLNKNITDKLEEMVKKYESTSDKWRAFGYQKAIQALKKHPKQITTYEEARSLPAVGAKLADKIWEIVESGGLRKLEEFKSSDEIKTLELFSNIWGAGAVTSRQWYQQGFRTLEDLRTKAKLTSQQKIGLMYYDEFLDRMSREEAGEIESTVRKAAELIQEGIIAQACGSYRRGKPTCGDVDVLVTHPDGKSHKGIFLKLINELKDQGFITDDLVTSENDGFITDDLVTSENDGNQQKYLGVCKLPGSNKKHRRLDIIVVPYSEYACALVYFTGSAHFNRSLRNLAKKCGMSLSNHALRKGVVRKGSEKIYEGTVVPTPTEESVMTLLGVPYRPPNERDH